MFTKTLTLASLLATSLALPNVTIKALPPGCASYPQYDADTQTAGPWTVSLSNSDNTALEGYGDSDAYSVAVDDIREGPYMRWGYLTINHRPDIARTVLQCSNNSLQIYTDTAVTRAGEPTNVQWTPLVLSPYENDASLLYLHDGVQPTVYEHYVDGVKQDGTFLGGYNTSTWGVQWQEAMSTSYFQPYFYLRVLPEGWGLEGNETKTFLKFQL